MNFFQPLCSFFFLRKYKTYMREVADCDTCELTAIWKISDDKGLFTQLIFSSV